jgi:hypothetical protein
MGPWERSLASNSESLAQLISRSWLLSAGASRSWTSVRLTHSDNLTAPPDERRPNGQRHRDTWSAACGSGGRGFDDLVRHVTPEIVEPVEIARIGREHVQHDVEVVRDDPGGLALTCNRARQ